MEKIGGGTYFSGIKGVISLVLLQHGKGADMGASFGNGASGSCWRVWFIKL
jgi:preprotein translocase subunit SecG